MKKTVALTIATAKTPAPQAYTLCEGPTIGSAKEIHHRLDSKTVVELQFVGYAP